MSDRNAPLVDWGLLWLRVLMGIGIATHGYSKIFGGKMEQFAGGVAELGFPLPLFFAWAAALSEFAGGIFIAAGFGTRWAALLVFFTMGVAAFGRHAADPFSAKEKALLFGVIAGALILMGGGKFALDRFLCRKQRSGLSY